MSKYLRLYGEIGEGECSAASFLAAMEEVPASKPLFVAINSPGGNYFDGLAIYNAIARRGNVVVIVDGLAASAASLIAMAARKIVMAPGSHLMIHSPLTTARGNPVQLESTLNTLRGIESEMAGIYAKRSFAMTTGDALILMRAESWLAAETASQVFRGVEVDATKVAASIEPAWLDGFRNAPVALAIARRLQETAPPRPAKAAAERDADRERRARARRRLQLRAIASAPDPVTATRNRRRARLEMKLVASASRITEERRVAAEQDAAAREAARAAQEDRYYRNWQNVPPRPGR